jgi:hypothetical protein
VESSTPFTFDQGLAKKEMLGLASTLFAASASGASAIPPATAASTGTSFYESPHKIFSPVEIDGHSTLVSSLEKSTMKVR